MYFNIPSIKTPENKDNLVNKIHKTCIEQTYEKSHSSCGHPVCPPPDDPGPQGEQAEHDDHHADAPAKHPVVPEEIKQDEAKTGQNNLVDTKQNACWINQVRSSKR